MVEQDWSVCNDISAEVVSNSLDGYYAAFGFVTSGIEVVDKIAAVRTNFQDKPYDNVVIKTIRRVR